MRRLRRLTARERIAQLRADQAAPIPDDALPSVHILWGKDEATGRTLPPPTDPETLAAMDEMIAAVYKAWKDGKLPKPRNNPQNHS